MGRKSKYSKELKMGIVKRYEKGEDSYESLATKWESIAEQFVNGSYSIRILELLPLMKNLETNLIRKNLRRKSYKLI